MPAVLCHCIPDQDAVQDKLCNCCRVNPQKEIPTKKPEHQKETPFCTALKGFFACQRSFSLQMACVMVPIGQKAHQLRGFQSTMAIRPSSREVSMRL